MVSQIKVEPEAAGDQISLEEVPAPVDGKSQEETQKGEEKNFVRPRFVKVRILLSLEW